MSYTRLLLVVLLLVPAISAAAQPASAQGSRVRRQANKPVAIPQTDTGKFGSFEHRPVQRVNSESAAPPQISVTFITADKPIVPAELSNENDAESAPLQPVGTTAGEPGPDAPQGFVDVHPAAPRELETPRKLRAPLEDASWAAALESMDAPRGTSAAAAQRMIPKELRGRFDGSKIPVRALTDLQVEPQPERSFGTVAWMIGGIAGLAVLAVLCSILFRMVRALWARRRFANVPAGSVAPADSTLSLPAASVPSAVSKKPAKLGRFASRLERTRKIKRADALDASVTTTSTPEATASVPKLASSNTLESAAHAHRPASVPRAVRGKSDRGEQTAATSGGRSGSSASSEPRVLSPSSGVGAFGRALSQIQVRTAGAKRAASH